MSNKTKVALFTFSTPLVALLPVIASMIPKDKSQITMSYDNRQVMERELLNKIPVGSNIQSAKQMMKRNGFKFTKHTNSALEFEKEESYWPTYEGTFWAADINLKNGAVSGAQVWIEPAD